MDDLTRQSLVTALAVVVAVLVSVSASLDQPYWAAISALVVSNVDRTALFTKGVLRVAGTVLGIVAGYYTALGIEGRPFAQLLVILVVAALGTYARRRSAYSYAWFYAAISFLLVMVCSLTTPEALPVRTQPLLRNRHRRGRGDHRQLGVWAALRHARGAAGDSDHINRSRRGLAGPRRRRRRGGDRADLVAVRFAKPRPGVRLEPGHPRQRSADVAAARHPAHRRLHPGRRARLRRDWHRCRRFRLVAAGTLRRHRAVRAPAPESPPTRLRGHADGRRLPTDRGRGRAAGEHRAAAQPAPRHRGRRVDHDGGELGAERGAPSGSTATTAAA
jgi:hypothetical protein